MALGAVLALLPPSKRRVRRRPAELDDHARQHAPQAVTEKELEVFA
jgi:hypothetical protein